MPLRSGSVRPRPKSRLAQVANQALPTAAASARCWTPSTRSRPWHARHGLAVGRRAAGDDRRAGQGYRAPVDRRCARGRGDGGGTHRATPTCRGSRSIAARSAEYVKQLDDALDLIADPAIAVGYFRRTDATFDRVARRDLLAVRIAPRGRGRRGQCRPRNFAAPRWSVPIGSSARAALLMLILLPIVVAAIARPVRALTRTMSELAAGNMAAEVAGQQHRDELGGMARAVLVFKEHMITWRQLAAEQEAERQRAEAEKRLALVNMAADHRDRDGSGAAADRRPHDLDGGNRGCDERIGRPHRRVGPGSRRRSRPGAGHRAGGRQRRRTARRVDPRNRRRRSTNPPPRSGAR